MSSREPHPKKKKKKKNTENTEKKVLLDFFETIPFILLCQNSYFKLGTKVFTYTKYGICY